MANKANNHYFLTDDEYRKLAKITGVPEMYVEKFDALGLLHNKNIVKAVLVYEYGLQRKHTKVAPIVIMHAISQKYGIPLTTVRSYLFCSKTIYCCMRCHKQTTVKQYKANGGLCNECMAKEIHL